jgi:hypothetical protein
MSIYTYTFWDEPEKFPSHFLSRSCLVDLNIHDLIYIGILRPWATFTQDCKAYFDAFAWDRHTYIIRHRAVTPRRAYITHEHVLCGDEASVQARLQANKSIWYHNSPTTAPVSQRMTHQSFSMLLLIAYKRCQIHEHIHTTAILVWNISIYQDTRTYYRIRLAFMIDIRGQYLGREVIKYFYTSKYWIHGLQNGISKIVHDGIDTLSFSDSRTAWQTISYWRSTRGKRVPKNFSLRETFPVADEDEGERVVNCTVCVPFYVEASLMNNIIEYYHLAWRFKNSMGNSRSIAVKLS